jgi:hypothetical protein
MSVERAERVELAESYEERLKNPLDKSIRPGGYFHSSAGIPVDCEGKAIPEAEWTEEDRKRLKGAAVNPAATTKRDGADVVEPSGSELRKGATGARRGV